ncbi:F0F1 ATP synthase subunit delta [Mycoplasma sp. 1654_15]|uniref:F0F1 ATP synthase subunit delta n=1 Tax=Mycoplasma sp. 1654_15 TaxID=2725994 RepID=UPI001448AED0|nr:F0F1 ATP synthase subunit delta [Mycoplasma sp. 1654_15]QJB71380.1 F0F1 ATP synthase subunit delta [Mycoplasma sp. 1654_15]
MENNSNILVYADSMLELAQEMDKVREFQEQFFHIENVLIHNPSLFTFLKSHMNSKTQRHEILDSVFTKKVSEPVLNFLKILIDKNLIFYWEKIFKRFTKNADEISKIARGIIYSGFPMHTSQINKIVNLLAQKLNKNIIVEHRIDKNLLAGIKIVIDNHIFENSVASLLNQIKSDILK